MPLSQDRDVLINWKDIQADPKAAACIEYLTSHSHDLESPELLHTNPDFATFESSTFPETTASLILHGIAGAFEEGICVKSRALIGYNHLKTLALTIDGDKHGRVLEYMDSDDQASRLLEAMTALMATSRLISTVLGVTYGVDDPYYRVRTGSFLDGYLRYDWTSRREEIVAWFTFCATWT